MQLIDERTKKSGTGQNETRSLRIVIAGGNGHVGSLLAKYFHARGHSVAGCQHGKLLKPAAENSTKNHECACLQQ